MKNLENIAYIDGANLHEGVKSLGWKIDYNRFRIWLKDKFNIKIAYIFIGLLSKNKDLYTSLQNAGFILIFKEITYDTKGKIKGNCDADLVLNIISDYYEKKYVKAILVSNYGDYSSVVSFLQQHNSFECIISPSNKCSFLLRKLNTKILYIDTQKNKICIKEKAPNKDKTL